MSLENLAKILNKAEDRLLLEIEPKVEETKKLTSEQITQLCNDMDLIENYYNSLDVDRIPGAVQDDVNSYCTRVLSLLESRKSN